MFSIWGSETTVFGRHHKEPVLLNVYDLCNLNDYTIAVGLGVFHSGIQVYGTEYGFGGHDLPATTGIFEMEPCNYKGELRDSFRFRQSILLGYTRLSRVEVQRIVDRLGRRQFSGRAYHLVSHNCNHFSIKLADILCGRPIPGWVNRLANLISRVPFLVQYLAPPHQRRQRQRRI
ncbi:desumoylating isopeptidase 2 [Drosophila serrata]|uniref:desumoylating isopeptidase 2 n=1 Tax=Drosophila serrata TaxID=7274 RepID=UPI000A1CFB80|nr:desumoylating isopeptidase 2 [Drosophila serrata]